MQNHTSNRFIDMGLKFINLSIVTRIKVREVFNLLSFVVFMFASQSAAADLNARLASDFNDLATFGDVAKAKELLKSNPQIRSMVDSLDDIRLIEGAMIAAAGSKNANYEFVTLMIENGADVNAKGVTGTALNSAILSFDVSEKKSHQPMIDASLDSSEEKLKIIELLVNEGADIDETMLELAIYKDARIAEIILDKGENSSLVNPQSLVLLIEKLTSKKKSAEETISSAEDPEMWQEWIERVNAGILLLKKHL